MCVCICWYMCASLSAEIYDITTKMSCSGLGRIFSKHFFYLRSIILSRLICKYLVTLQHKYLHPFLF